MKPLLLALLLATSAYGQMDTASLPTERSVKTRELREAKKDLLRATAKVNRLERWFRENLEPAGYDSVCSPGVGRWTDSSRVATPAEIERQKIYWAKVRIGYDLLTLWDGYAKECYADSSQQWVPRSPPGSYNDSTGIGVVLAVYYPPTKEWVHRTPSLEGFIEYLRKR
jgi:hypothetical protein